MVEYRHFTLAGWVILLLLSQLPSYRTEKVPVNSRPSSPNSKPNRRIVPLSHSDLLAAQLHRESPVLKRSPRKLENDGATDAASLDAVNPDEYQGVVGRPGVDFPVLSHIPNTNFSCRQYKSPGYYADLDTNCQVFHICDGGQKVSFICPNGTIFRQSHLICDWWFRVDCGNSVNLYAESAEQLANDQKFYREKSRMQEKLLEPSNKYQNVLNTKDSYSSTKTKASGNQPLQQNTFPYQSGQNQNSYNSNEQIFSGNTVTQSPNNFYSTQGQTNAQILSSDNVINLRQKVNRNSHLIGHNTVGPSQTKIYTEGNSLDNESQVLAESANYGNGKENHYKGVNYYNIDGNPKEYTTSYQKNSYNQQIVNNPEASTAPVNNFIQSSTPQPLDNYSLNSKSTNYAKSTTQQANSYQSSNTPRSDIYTQSTVLQQSNTYTPSTNIEQNKYPQRTTSQHINNYPQGTTVQDNSYSQPLTYQQTDVYQGRSPNELHTTNQQTTIGDLLRLKSLSSPTSFSTVNYSPTNYVSYTTPTYEESSTPYTLSSDVYPTTFSYSPTTFSSNPTTSSEIFSTLNFNQINSGRSNLVPEPINNALDESSNGDTANQVDSISIYYDQINNKESVRFPLNTMEIKNKISVSDISLNQEGQTPSAVYDLSNSLPSVLTDSTKEGYSLLFSNRSQYNGVNTGNNQEIPRFGNDFALEENPSTVQTIQSTLPTSTTTASPRVYATSNAGTQSDLELRHSSDLRELAQVFSRALSAYLEDPENFKRILSEVRPTEPNIKTTTVDPYKKEVLEFSGDTKNFPTRNPSNIPTVFTALNKELKTSNIADQVNNLATEGFYLSNSKNLYGGFQNNSFSQSPDAYTISNTLEETTKTYSTNISPLVSRQSEATVRNFISTTPIPSTSFDSNYNVIGAQEVNNLFSNKNLYGEDNYDRNNLFVTNTYDYSFGANSKQTSQQTVEMDNDESLVPYDSQSIVSKDNLLRLQNAHQKYYENLKYGHFQDFSKVSENYQTTNVQNGETTTPSIIFHQYPHSTAQSLYNTVNFISTEPSPSFYPSVSHPTTQFTPRIQKNSPMYQEAKELFGSLNESSANILMNMMHEAETNSTLRRLVLLLVNDKTGKKTPEESRNKLLEALLEMPQRVPGYPPSSISRTFSPKLPRRVKVLKSRMLSNEKSSTKNYVDTQVSSTVATTTTTTSTMAPSDTLLPEKLSSESDTRAVELLKSLYVLAAKWG